jgi:hypothetical protein
LFVVVASEGAGPVDLLISGSLSKLLLVKTISNNDGAPLLFSTEGGTSRLRGVFYDGLSSSSGGSTFSAWRSASARSQVVSSRVAWLAAAASRLDGGSNREGPGTDHVLRFL